MGDFVSIEISTNPEEMAQQVYDEIAVGIPGWEQNPANLETFIVAALTRLMAEIATLGAQASQAIFYEFGRLIVNLPPLLPTKAVAASTWTMIDNAGYVIPAGTQVVLSSTGSDQQGFETMNEVTVPPGSTATGAGEVSLRALLEGDEGNDLGSIATLATAYDFVESIEVTADSDGGSDGETEEEYVARLVDEMSLLAPRPILIDDYPPFIRRIAGVERAIAIDNWDPADDSLDNVLTIGFVAIDEDGEDVSAPLKEEIQTDLESRVISDMVVNKGAPTYTPIFVTTTVRCYAGYDAVSVDAAVTAAIQAYLDPSSWGVNPLNQTETEQSLSWRNAKVVRYGEMWSLIDRVPGVDYVESMTMGTSTAPAGTTNISLSGVVPLTRPAATGTGISVTANEAA